MTSTEAARAGTARLSWYKKLSVSEKRTFWAAFGGWALEVRHSDADCNACHLDHAGRSAWAVGGWIAGMLADRIGRVRTLQITILWFSLFTFLRSTLGIAKGQRSALLGLGRSIPFFKARLQFTPDQFSGGNVTSLPDTRNSKTGVDFAGIRS